MRSAIDVPQLRSAVDALLKAAEDRMGALVSIYADHYWLVELRAAFGADYHEPRQQPGYLGVGQISDDIASVTEVAQGLQDPESWPILWHDLEHVTGLLRALAWMDLPKDS
ncbi:MAG TPA: hypothetical protein VMA72_19790 [Streptosporangiaceae bacterium]|nr:hypothetical protein [Streptosporangiaceae bacterium]